MSKIFDVNLKNPRSRDMLLWVDGYWRNFNFDELLASTGLQSAVVLSPASALSSSQTDDYAPVGIETARMLRLVPNVLGSSSISGIQAPNYMQFLTIVNIGNASPGNENIVLLSEDAGSVPANRFLLIDEIVISSNDSLNIFYDLDSARWRSM